MRLTVTVIVLALAISGTLWAQGGPSATSAEPFKLGTFEIGGSPAVGIVLRDSLVVHLGRANNLDTMRRKELLHLLKLAGVVRGNQNAPAVKPSRHAVAAFCAATSSPTPFSARSIRAFI